MREDIKLVLEYMKANRDVCKHVQIEVESQGCVRGSILKYAAYTYFRFFPYRDTHVQEAMQRINWNILAALW